MRAALLSIFYMIFDLFMAPGYSILRHFHLHADTVTACLVAFVFWCVFFSILGAMQDQIRAFLSRNNKPSK